MYCWSFKNQWFLYVPPALSEQLTLHFADWVYLGILYDSQSEQH
jgi:hypothetical protein